ncbi:putative ribosomal protein L2 [Cinnamomum micranthum f. kanehirae]|uniref:Putative ribosomal protein L2 n=1 Tax=Cinnamomum micranthum f. kanehirae TaxID=337451 RepID=A0A3S3P004_9MAGN|nr:putative ribosomal protein L2 [Cinnamomum micranthum f. kanehirae]
MIFLPPEVKERSFPFGPVVGEEGFEPPTPWFVATCSNPLSYRPHPVSTGSVPWSTLKKEPFLPSAISDLRGKSMKKKGSNGTIPPSPQNERGDLVVLGL